MRYETKRGIKEIVDPQTMADASPATTTVENGSANTTVFLAISLFYIYCRSYSSSNSTLSFLKGKFRSLCGILLKVSILTALVYNISVNFLATKFSIDRIQLEISKKLDHNYRVDYKDYSLDLVSIMVYSLKISEALLISCVFLATSLLAPDESEFYERYKFDESLVNFNSSMSSLCKLWGVFRIPILFYAGTLKPLFGNKLATFISQLFSNIELVTVSIFLILIKFKNYTPWRNHSVDIGLLALTLTAYGFAKYGINLIDFPFELTKSNLDTIVALQFGLMIGIYLSVCGIVFPRRIQACDHLSEKNNRLIQGVENTNEVALLESIIEFEDKKGLINV